ncbi:MAG: ABC transporter permease, partial [Nitriliruptoraceae bacterium]
AAAPHLAEAAVTAVMFAAGATAVSLALAALLAAVTERPGARLVGPTRLLVAVPSLLPNVVVANAWIALLEPRVGLVNVAAAALGATGPVLDAYSLPGAIWIEAADGVLLPYALLVASWRAIDPAALQASRIAGAGGPATFRRIAVPLMAPAILGASLLMLARGLGSFAVPASVGARAGYRFLSTELLALARTVPPDLGLAAVAGLGLVVATTGLVVLHHQLLGGDGRGRWTRPAPSGRTEGCPRLAADLGGLALAALLGLLPLLAMGWVSVQPFLRPPTPAALAASDLDAYRWALGSSLVRRAALNSLQVGAVAAVVTLILGVAVARTGRPGTPAAPRTRGVLDALATLPVALPSSVLALALLWSLLLAGYDLLGGATVAILAGVSLAVLPYGVRAAAIALDRVPAEFEQASLVSGAGTVTTLRRITLPVATAGLLAGAVIAATRGVRALAVPALLAGPGTEVLTVVLLDLQRGARYAEANAVAVLLVAGLAAAAGLAALLRLPARGRR